MSQLTRPTTDFRCFYCGKFRPPEESSREHIVPQCIGARGVAVITREVCASCNEFMANHVEPPFARDFTMRNARFKAGTAAPKRDPILPFGELGWEREEQATVYVVDRHLWLFAVQYVDGDRVLFVRTDELHEQRVLEVQRLAKRNFKRHRLGISGVGQVKERDIEVAKALVALGNKLPLRWSIDINAWNREVVKIGLGLACKWLGPPFVESAAAEHLRGFLFEEDRAKRAVYPLRGVVGPLREGGPSLAQVWGRSPDWHLFALLASRGSFGFVADFFGEHESVIGIPRSEALEARLPGGEVRGLVLRVNAKTGAVLGPDPAVDLLESRSTAFGEE